MEFYKEKIEEMVHYLKKQRDYYNNEASSCPPGRLISTKQNGYLRYFNAQTINGKYTRKGITSDKKAVMQLARKEFLERTIEYINFNINVLENALGKLKTFGPDDIISTMKQTYKLIPKEFFYNEREFTSSRFTRHKDWLAIPYEINNYRTEGKNKITSRGLKMRSKSEVMIAELLYQYDIPFKYEKVLYLNGQRAAPDFTFQDNNKSEFYWEYCGMMNNSDYVKNHIRKRSLYEANDIFPWKNIYYTYETDGNINLQAIENFIKDHLIPRL